MHMITVSSHRFHDPSDHSELCISITEVIEEEYGLHVWPCSIALAEYVWQQKDRFFRSNVVELGAGTALPGIVAAKVGAFVTLTDRNDKPKVFENLERICEQNGVDCKIQGLTWGDWDSASLSLTPHIILGADVFYNSNDFDDLFATVTFFLRGNPDAVFITTYEPRSGHRLIEFLMEKWKLQCIKLLDAHEILPSTKLSTISTSIQIVELKATPLSV